MATSLSSARKSEFVEFPELVSDRHIVLLGAGQLGRMTLEMWPSELRRPSLVVDQVASNDLCGVPIITPSMHEPDTSKFLYVLCYFKESASQINSLFRDWLKQEIVIAYDVLTGLRPDKFSNGWSPKHSFDFALETADAFTDERSRDVFMNALRWKYDRVIEDDFLLSSESDKYSLSKYGRSRYPYTDIFDFGSYDGSFLKGLASQGVTNSTMHAYEPDPESRQKLISNLGEIGLQDRVAVSAQAVSAASGYCHFQPGGLLSSRIIASANDESFLTSSVSLKDALCRETRDASDISLIKLHVEGAEFPTLAAAIRSGFDLGPYDLFINLSHDEESLLELPRMMRNLSTHELFLDTHSLFAEGLTMFAKSTRG